MRIRDTSGEEEASLNMTPLIDMVFLLLIFFLVATTFAQEERKLDIQLPATATIQPLSAPPQRSPSLTHRTRLDAAGQSRHSTQAARTGCGGSEDWAIRSNRARTA